MEKRRGEEEKKLWKEGRREELFRRSREPTKWNSKEEKKLASHNIIAPTTGFTKGDARERYPALQSSSTPIACSLGGAEKDRGVAPTAQGEPNQDNASRGEELEEGLKSPSRHSILHPRQRGGRDRGGVNFFGVLLLDLGGPSSGSSAASTACDSCAWAGL